MNKPFRKAKKTIFSGYFSAYTVVFIWSFWLIVSRTGANSELTIYDLAAMRYGISALVSLPFILYFKPWKQLSIYKTISLSLVLGPCYILTVFSGFLYAPAAHGGIFMNGLMPLFALFFNILFFSFSFDKKKMAAAIIILVSTILLGINTDASGFSKSWLGDICFVIGAIFFIAYVSISQAWSLKMIDVIFCGAFINAIFFLPIWFLYLPSGFGNATANMIILQAVYQGLVPNLLGLILIAHASQKLGSEVTSGIMAIVPGLGAVLGVFILNETLGALSWIAIAGLTFGLFLISGKNSSESKVSKL